MYSYAGESDLEHNFKLVQYNAQKSKNKLQKWLEHEKSEKDIDNIMHIGYTLFIPVATE